MLFAIEENDESPKQAPQVEIKMEHFLRAISETKKQITPEMLEFYKSFGKLKLTS